MAHSPTSSWGPVISEYRQEWMNYCERTSKVGPARYFGSNCALPEIAVKLKENQENYLVSDPRENVSLLPVNAIS